MYGKGRVIHIGCAFSSEMAVALFKHAGILEPFVQWIGAPEGVELLMREKEGKRWLFALNYQSIPQPIKIHSFLRSVLTGKEIFGDMELPTYGVEVFEI